MREGGRDGDFVCAQASDDRTLSVEASDCFEACGRVCSAKKHCIKNTRNELLPETLLAMQNENRWSVSLSDSLLASQKEHKCRNNTDGMCFR